MSIFDKMFNKGPGEKGTAQDVVEKTGGISPEQYDFEKAKEKFLERYSQKIKVWEAKGYTYDIDELVKAYKQNPGLELATTQDKKIAWGKPEGIVYERPR